MDFNPDIFVFTCNEISTFPVEFLFLLVFSILTLNGCKDDDYTHEPDDQPSGIARDIEGNIYSAVIIGDQIWMASNLRTTKYRDGSAIDYPGMDTLAWQNNTNGAYALQSNNEMYKDIYGGLCNWCAVSNSSGICPSGWRVATSEDWRILLKYLLDEHGCTNDYTGDKHAGNVLKSCRQIESPMGGDCETAKHPRWNFHASQNYFTHVGVVGIFCSVVAGFIRSLKSFPSFSLWPVHPPACPGILPVVLEGFRFLLCDSRR